MIITHIIGEENRYWLILYTFLKIDKITLYFFLKSCTIIVKQHRVFSSLNFLESCKTLVEQLLLCSIS